MFKENNLLEIDVSNLMAERIAEMERQGMLRKRFYNINFPTWLPENRDSRNLFTATDWLPMDSGLIGQVTLTPIERLSP